MKLLFFIAILITSITSHAQFKSARLQAAGLTCAMCTKAIHEALKQLDAVESVKPDIKNSEFVITFKDNKSVDPDILKNAVEDAGFSVARLRMTANFNKIMIEKDSHIDIGGKTFHFLRAGNQTLEGEKTITLVDKNFTSPKEFKKYAASTQMSCVQTGKAAECCRKADNELASGRIYHVTI